MRQKIYGVRVHIASDTPFHSLLLNLHAIANTESIYSRETSRVSPSIYTWEMSIWECIRSESSQEMIRVICKPREFQKEATPSLNTPLSCLPSNVNFNSSERDIVEGTGQIGIQYLSWYVNPFKNCEVFQRIAVRENLFPNSSYSLATSQTST